MDKSKKATKDKYISQKRKPLCAAAGYSVCLWTGNPRLATPYLLQTLIVSKTPTVTTKTCIYDCLTTANDVELIGNESVHVMCLMVLKCDAHADFQMCFMFVKVRLFSFIFVQIFGIFMVCTVMGFQEQNPNI